MEGQVTPPDGWEKREAEGPAFAGSPKSAKRALSLLTSQTFY